MFALVWPGHAKESYESFDMPSAPFATRYSYIYLNMLLHIKEFFLTNAFKRIF